MLGANGMHSCDDGIQRLRGNLQPVAELAVPHRTGMEASHIEGAIIDKNCRIGRDVRIINRQGVEATEETLYSMIRDGIVVIPKATTLPDGWTL